MGPTLAVLVVFWLAVDLFLHVVNRLDIKQLKEENRELKDAVANAFLNDEAPRRGPRSRGTR